MASKRGNAHMQEGAMAEHPDAAVQFFARLKEESIPRIERSTVPLYGIRDAQIRRDRTGVLYKVAGHHFILTASHYLRTLVEDNIPLCVDRTDGLSLPVPLAGAMFHGTEEEGRDVAAIKLPADVAKQLLPQKEFLTHSEVRLTDENADSLYVVFGYPERWSGVATRSSVLSRPLVYVCRPYEGECDPTACFDPKVHVVLAFEQNAYNIFQETTEELPPLQGVSGCGIWKVADWSSEGLQRWQPEHTSLVALQHHWDRNRDYVRGTWLGYALALIKDKYPDVSAAMDLVYPAG